MDKAAIPEVAAGMISSTICDYITCKKDSSEFRISEKWINDPSDGFLTFIFCCKTLGLDNKELRESIILASEIEDFSDSHTKPSKLTLVQSSGLGYNYKYERHN